MRSILGSPLGMLLLIKEGDVKVEVGLDNGDTFCDGDEDLCDSGPLHPFSTPFSRMDLFGKPTPAP